MSDRDLEIKFRIDDTQAKQKISEHDARMAASKQKALDHYLAVNKVVKETSKEVEDVGKKGAKSFMDIAAAGGVAYLGFSRIIGVVKDIAAEIEKAKQKSRELQNTFAEDRDRYRELAFIMGKEADNAFVLEQKKFNLKAAMSTAEGLTFRTEFQNAGAQFVGKTMTKKESEDYELQSAQLAAAKNIKANEAGDFFGTVSGFKNRTAMGDKASEATLADARRVIGILGAGKGTNSVLINQFSQIASASLAEDEMQGIFQNPEDIASFISVGAEKSDARSGYMLRAAIRGMRDFGGDAGPLLQRAGITPKTPLMQGIKAISKPIKDEAAASGMKTEDIVRKYFVDEESVNAISTYLNKGVEDGLFDARAQVAKSLPDDTAIKEINKFQTGSETGVRRIHEAAKDSGEAQVASTRSMVEVLQKEAEAKYAKEEAESPTSMALQNLFMNVFAGEMFMGGAKSKYIQMDMANIIQKRAKGYGLEINTDDAMNANTAESMNEEFNKIFSQISAAGGNPLVDALEKNTEVVKKNNELMEKQGGGQTVPPALLISAGMQGRR